MTKIVERDISGDQMWIHMGPQHPVTHGLWTFKIKTDGETILDAECLIGYLHRTFEKLAENRTYEQFVPIADRLCYVANFSWEYGYVHTVEKAFGIADQIPERAEYIRVIMLELQRIASHLVNIFAIGADAGVLTMLMYPMRDREYFLDLMEHAMGQRMMYNYNRIGGIANELPKGWVEDCYRLIDWIPDRLREYEQMFDDSKVYMMRMKDIGLLDPDYAMSMGVTGPALRGSGVKADVRKIEPYSVYEQFKFSIVTEEGRDNFARYRVRMNEIRESTKIIRQALDELPGGPIKMERPPKRAPSDTTCYSRIEDPRGEQAWYLVTKAKSDKPWRLKIRSPAFSNISVFPHLIRGGKLADIPMVIVSIDLCIGEIDR
ncbi:MAG: NADH-quinone oxidoreductase subunit D [Candidatus Hodarchaeota archaeon]